MQISGRFFSATQYNRHENVRPSKAGMK